MKRLIEIIESEDAIVRNISLHEVCVNKNYDELSEQLVELDQFWRTSTNLYHQVRALFFVAGIYRYYLPLTINSDQKSLIPFEAHQHLLQRRFVEAIDGLKRSVLENGLSVGMCSGLAQAYHELGFQTLANQVRKSVRTVSGNQWMFRVGHPADHPLRIVSRLMQKTSQDAFPVLCEKTAVRMDFSHSGWSDIFFLGMDFPEGARVINASINLAVMGRDDQTQPPIECYLRVIDRPIIRLCSIDLNAQTEIERISDVFDFARDYLGLLKAAVIASGIVPPGLEGCEVPVSELLSHILGRTGFGLEIVSKVNDIPKGSRLAVSTNLLGSLISICMRATGQIRQLTGGLKEKDRRLVAARSILGEWIGGSGGGWQDSGGVWPGIKLISGTQSEPGDPEFGVSRGRLLPNHLVFGEQEISLSTRQKLQESLVLVHGGMAQNVGPILEMVTERYLLRSPQEWEARQQAIKILDEIKSHLSNGDIRAVGMATHKNFFGPLQSVIPWCTNLYTQELVRQCQHEYEDQFWGFWMLGGMAGGGMGFIFDPAVKPSAQTFLKQIMCATKNDLQDALPFAMEPVVYEFSINDRGSWCDLLDDHPSRPATLPEQYYEMLAPAWLRAEPAQLTGQTRVELERLGSRLESDDRLARKLIQQIVPRKEQFESGHGSLDSMLSEYGFDEELHQQIQSDLRSGRYGLAQNRLSVTTKIEDAALDEVFDSRGGIEGECIQLGKQSIARGEVAAVTLAAGVGSRWTEGAGVVKALHPFCRFNNGHRSFIELHLAKSRKASQDGQCHIPHVFTTGYLTHDPIANFLRKHNQFGYQGAVYLSRGKSVGLRMIPMVRDLQFAWEEVSQQILDKQQQKMRESLRAALTDWARHAGEGSDYRDNLAMQCLHPVGHWYEIPNMLLNGVLENLMLEHPQVKYLLLHNIDTTGASIEAGLLGQHIQSGNCLSFEVIERKIEDRGGGLAKVNGRLRLLEGLAMPREADEFELSFYNSMTTWIDVDQLLQAFGLGREELRDMEKVRSSIRELSQRMPTYITLKDVKKRWGNGQEDVFPVSQFEKLWSDMSSLPEISCGFFVVDQYRGAQLKEQSQLDVWVRDGSAAKVEMLCDWG